MFKDGYLSLGTWEGVPIRLHWSAPLGALVFGGLRFAPGFWLGFALLIMVHELGHAWVVKRVGARARSVDILAYGGLCHWQGQVSPMGRACIAWGGVWAQALAFGAAATIQAVLGAPDSEPLAQLASVFARTNLLLIAINLLPIRPLDGAEAWALLPLLGKWLAGARDRRRRRHAVADSKLKLARLDALEAQVEAPSPEVKALVGNLLQSLRDDEPDPQ